MSRNDKLIFHIDVNSAYLSWTAIKLLNEGSNIDIRKIHSVIGGNEEKRHGVVLAASIPVKKLGVKTGESLYEAKKKCPNLVIYPPNHNWYFKISNEMIKILKEYSPKIERYSIDECFMDCTHYKDNYQQMAINIKTRISTELGFNCNIGISTNKLLAKMASDFKPKNSVHTLFKNEIKKKMWPLPVGELFMVGKSTKLKLAKLNIKTIGELANLDVDFLIEKMHSHGKVIYEYANGIDNSELIESESLKIKGIGNSITLSKDIDNIEEALKILLSLTENVSRRLRESKNLCSIVTVIIKTNNFVQYSHQKVLSNCTDNTMEIFKGIKKAFCECYRGEKIRLLGVRLTKLCDNKYYQPSLFDFENDKKQKNLDIVMDRIRKKYGKESIIRSELLNSSKINLKDDIIKY
ncbi:DNA polymerase IV [Clostridium taeniosporum]|uniref:DNA polymerase IV n=1 Tax=Clostridium taeniosporum TaxID=394958 RepID=A0A1D7XHU2_9CLOT|nr:DNA polymerase IV [Clostridium taeniosporum]AOR22639.1 DNA polymerase IV [Clostridium taeniosporum]